MADPSGGSKIWQALSRAGDSPASVAQMVRDRFGSTPRGAPNTGAAAAAYGVSRRTVQRWVKEGIPPHSDPAKHLAADHATWQNSPDGRAGAMNSRRESRLRSQGTAMVISGKFTVSAGDTRGVRTTTIQLTGAQLSAILDANLAGDDERAHRLLEEAVGSNFGHTPSIDIAGLKTFR